MPRLHRIVWSAAEWVETLAAIPAVGELPARTLLVPSHEAGLGIRDVVLRAGRPDLLAGLRILTPSLAAQEVLAAAGIAWREGEDDRRAARIQQVAPALPSLQTIPLGALVGGQGWDAALASALAMLEGACLLPTDLRASGEPRALDLAAVWDACDAAAGLSWTRGRILREATTLLADHAATWPFEGPTLTVAAGDEPAAFAAFAAAIDGARVVAVPARPLHPRAIARWRTVWGAEIADAVQAAAAQLAQSPARTERDRLARWLFASPEILLGERDASPGDDGSLALEIHPGIEEECAAAVAWVAREIAEHGTPLARVALLLPADDPVAAIAIERLSELPWPDATPSPYVAGGLPLIARPAGARLAAAIGALDDGNDDVRYAALCRARDATLAAQWEALNAWWTVQDPGDAIALDAVRAQVAPLLEDAELAAIAGRAASRLLLDATANARWPVGRFGEGVYIGTLESAIGLSFDAVRVLGLAEGSVPPAPREHPLLHDTLCARLSPALPSSADHGTTRLHAFERAVRGAQSRLVLSAPLTGADRGQRSPSTVFVDAATAVRRAAKQGDPPRVADDEVLASLWFGARGAAEDATPTARQAARRAAQRRTTPAAWSDGGPWDVTRARALAAGEPLVHTPDVPDTLLPGLTPSRALSASAAQALVACPRAFLFERVLGWHQLEETPSPYALSPLEYGQLLHAALQRFSEAHGEAFGAREGTLETWIDRAVAIGIAEMQAHVRARQLRGASVRTALEQRLSADVRSLIRYDWNRGRPRRFVATERAFGEDAPLALTRAGGVFVRGRLDRLDVEGDVSLLRDFKSGRAHPRDTDDYEVPYDMQLGLYLLVLEQLADVWGVPARAIAAYVYPGHAADHERAFRADAANLAAATREWLAVCRALLDDRAFPQTPEAATCERCAFRRVCGEQAPARAAAALGDATGAGRAFAQMWRAGDEAEDDA